jgi:hypothetical protein
MLTKHLEKSLTKDLWQNDFEIESLEDQVQLFLSQHMGFLATVIGYEEGKVEGAFERTGLIYSSMIDGRGCHFPRAVKHVLVDLELPKLLKADRWGFCWSPEGFGHGEAQWRDNFQDWALRVCNLCWPEDGDGGENDSFLASYRLAWEADFEVSGEAIRMGQISSRQDMEFLAVCIGNINGTWEFEIGFL